MIIECEACGTKYRLDDSKAKDGVRVRCSRCQNVFRVSPPVSPEEPPLFGDVQETTEGPSLNEWEEEFATKPPPPKMKVAAAPPEKETSPGILVPSADGEKPLFPEEEYEEKPWAEEEIFPSRAPFAREARYRKERRVSKIFLLSILLIVVIFGALYYFARTHTSVPLFESIYGGISRLLGDGKEHQLSMIFMRGSEHQVDGKTIFVIQGKVTNRSKETKRYVKLNGYLFNNEGKIVAKGAGYCGYTITTSDIKNSTHDKLKASFGYIALAKVPPVPAEKSIPFTIIFFEPPQGATEYTVEIADAPPLT